MADNFFCLDLGETAIRLADVKKSGNFLEATSLGITPSTPNYFLDNLEKTIEIQSDIIGKLVSSLKINKKNVNAIIPDTYTYSQILEMPVLKEKELISAIKYQADQFIPMPIEDANMDIEIIYENDKDKKIYVLIEAVPKKLVDKIQNTIELSGLIPESIENELSADSRLFSQIYRNLDPETNDGIALINFGYNSSTIYFYNSKLALLSQNHSFNIGTSLFLKELQMNLNIDQNKAIEIMKTYEGQSGSSISIDSIINPAIKEFTFEVKRFINSIQQKYQLKTKKMYLTNEAYKFLYLNNVLESALGINVSVFNPYTLFNKSNLIESLKTDLSYFTSAIGGNLR